MSAAPPLQDGARRSLRRRLAAGPLARAVARADLRVYRFVRADLHHPGAVAVVRAFSSTGEHAALWHGVAAAGMLVDRRGRGRWRRGVVAVIVTQVANGLLKLVARRSRPAFDDLPALVRTPTQLSFPSAHASTSFAAARGFALLVPAPLARALYLAAGAMGLSRVYLGVHFPTDIAVGAALGTLIGSAGRR